MGKYRPSEDSDLSESDLGQSLQLQKKKKNNGTKKKDVTPVRASKKKSSIPPVRKPNKNRSLAAKSLRSSEPEPLQVSDSKSDFSYQETVVKKSKVQSRRGNGAQKMQNRESDIGQNGSYRRQSPAKKAVKTTADKRSGVQEHYELESGYVEEQNSSHRSTDEAIGRGGYQDTNENMSERSDSVFEKQDDAELATVAERARAETVSVSFSTENEDQEMRAKQNDLEAGARGESSGRSMISADVEPPDIRESVERSEKLISPVVAARLPPEIILAHACVNTDADFNAAQVRELPVNPPETLRDNRGDTSDRNTLDYWLNMLNNEGPDAKGTTSKALNLWAKDVAIKREQATADLVKEKALYVRQKRLRLSGRNT